MKSLVPKKISKYRILKVLGQGAMGKVYLGIDDSIDRKVAIKTISIDSNSHKLTEEYAQRFVDEAKSLAKCTHPNIVTILEFGQEKKAAFMVLEYIKGPNLSHVLNNKKGVSLMQALSFFTQLLKALNVAHKSHIIHRDIKPENVLITSKGMIKLTDFGIAKTSSNDHLTQVGMTLGTPKYMAPEQLFSNEKIGPYTDIYSLFVLLFEMLGVISDQKYFDFIKLPTIPQMAKHNNFNHNTKVPSCMVSFISKGLKTAVIDRFQSISEVIVELKPIINTIKNQKIKASDTTNPLLHLTQNTLSIITNENLELEIPEDKFNAIRYDLSSTIGPIADLIIIKCLQQTAIKTDYKTKFDKLITSLAEYIEDQDLKEDFLNKWREY